MTPPRRRPPLLARLLVWAWLRGDAREVIRGDLDELFDRARRDGATPFAARRLYWTAALASIGSTRPGESGARRAHDGDASMPSIRSLHSGLGTDLRYTLRGLGHSPWFAAVAILSLAVGIGANTAIFSVVRSVLLTPLQVERPEDLRLVYWSTPREYPISNYSSSGSTDPETGRSLSSNYTYPQYAALRAAAPDDTDLFGFNFVREVSIVAGDRPATVGGGLLVSGDFFQAMRLPVAMGRPLSAADDAPGAAPVAVISHAFWQRAFGGSPDVLETPARLNGQPIAIVGVTAPGYRGLSPGGFFPPTDVTMTFEMQPMVAPSWGAQGLRARDAADRAWVRLGARVPSHLADPAVEGALTPVLRAAVAETLGSAPDDMPDVAARLLPGARGIDSLRRNTERPLAILMVVAGVVLLIACANLAGLMLARGAFRQRELAVRRALGASRLRLARQLLLDGVVLAVAGGVAGLLLAYWSGRAIANAITAGLGPVAVTFALDREMLLIALGVSTAAALLSGLIPALRLSRSSGSGDLNDRGTTAGPGRMRLGRALIALQIAASVPLLVGAGLFLRTAANLGQVDLGYDPDGLIFFRLDTTLSDAGADRAEAIFDQVLARIERLPGVMSASLIENVPMSGWQSSRTITVNGEEHRGTMNAGGPGLFETLGVELVAGRDLGPQDRAGAPQVVVVNERAAGEWFGGNAIGRRIDDLGPNGAEVVGVVADMKYTSVRSDLVATFYDPYAQRSNHSRMHVVVRAAVPAAALEPQIREAVASVDRLLPVTDYRSQMDEIGVALSRERVFTRLLVVFGIFALLLASVGLHGLTSFAVARRTNEIGIRLALGARRAQIVWLMLRQVVLLAAVGLAIGVPLALVASPVVESMLYGLAPGDPATIALAATVMLSVALLAGWLPARRAARLEALHALRRD